MHHPIRHGHPRELVNAFNNRILDELTGSRKRSLGSSRKVLGQFIYLSGLEVRSDESVFNVQLRVCGP